MKKTSIIFAAFFAASTLSAQSLDQLKSYAAKALPRCAGGSIEMVAIPQAGPAGFNSYGVTLKSSDETCGMQKYLLVSPSTGQTLLGAVIGLPRDSRPLHVRLGAQATELLRTPITARVAPIGLPDGLKEVTMIKQTPLGPFAYMGYVDASGKFLIVGLRGNLKDAPAKSIRDALGFGAAARRGSSVARVEIIEISDFQCPTCARAHEKLEPILSKNLGKISYARLDLPLFEHHDWAFSAALAGRAIQRVAPAKYWQYVDFIFKNQDTIKAAQFDKLLRDYLEDHDIDWKPVEKIYRSSSERTALLDQVSRAFAAGINSTPTFIVNGQILGFGPDGAFTISTIKQALGVK